MKKPVKVAFPKRLYVVREDLDFVAYETVEDCDSGFSDAENQPVGVYELVETKKLTIRRELK